MRTGPKAIRDPARTTRGLSLMVAGAAHQLQGALASAGRQARNPDRSILAVARRPQHGSPQAGIVRVKSPRDAKHAEERQTTRMRMNAPQVYALRLCKPAEHCSLSLGVLRRL